MGFLAGMNLALAGVILQGILRNPLADPGIIGITSGGALAAMIIMILMPTSVLLVPIGAFVTPYFGRCGCSCFFRRV